MLVILSLFVFVMGYYVYKKEYATSGARTAPAEDSRDQKSKEGVTPHDSVNETKLAGPVKDRGNEKR